MKKHAWTLDIGATPHADGTRFTLWAPDAQQADVVLIDGGREDAHALKRDDDGYCSALVPGVSAGARYKYRVDGQLYPDPAARSLPEGIHGASQVIDPTTYRWSDAGWSGIRADGLVIYELHIGTFTAEGTFDAAIDRLHAVQELGVTAVEVMPIASFPGTRNWGYDGVGLYAPSACYGGPEGFRRFVDAAHARGLGVILDVVYNHFGPEGNYLPALTGGRFFNPNRKTAWGDAINYDGEDSGPVRQFMIQNALHWAHEYHVDGLRLDATHAIADDSPVHLLQEIARELHALTPPRLVIAEDERNERKVLLPESEGGYGLDGVWADDLHHQLRRLVAGDNEGYFRAFSGTMKDVATTLRKGWFYEGQHSVQTEKPRGTPADGLPRSAFVHCIQNHDQVGNRAMGDRLNHAIPLPLYRAASAVLLLSPCTPLLWMGQEWAASTPFCYFTDLSEEMGRKVTRGRREEFRHFSAFADPATRVQIPDPQDPDTFERSRLRWEELEQRPHCQMREFYMELLRLRRHVAGSNDDFQVQAVGERALAMRRASNGNALLLVASFGEWLSLSIGDTAVATSGEDSWTLALVSEVPRFGGTGSVRFENETLLMLGPGAVVLSAGLT